jgi:hypothetical protein
VPTNQEPPGDYGYDLVHEDVGRRAGRGERTREEDARASVEARSPGSGGDLGYDEAHDF